MEGDEKCRGEAETVINPPTPGAVGFNEEETVLASPSAEGVIHAEGAQITQSSALRQLQLLFQHFPGAFDALEQIKPEDPKSGDVSAIVRGVVERLLSLQRIQDIVAGQRDQLMRAVGRSLKESEQWVGRGTGINTTVLVDSNARDNPDDHRIGLLCPIGSGNFGCVAIADIDPEFPLEGVREGEKRPECLVKILRKFDPKDEEDQHRRFRHEWKTLRAIPGGAPGVYAHGYTAEGRPYFLMDYIRGLDLATVIRSVSQAIEQDDEARLQWPSQWMYLALASMSRTMHEVHNPGGNKEIVTSGDRLDQLAETGMLKKGEVGIVHRDLKPANFRLDLEGRIWVLDFGIGRSLEADQTRLTVTGRAMGTPSYIAPELWDDAKNRTTPRADVYSLGCMAYELLTGVTPFAYAGNDVLQVLKAHQEHYPNFDLIPNARARKMIERMMHKDPAKRPDMSEVSEVFHSVFMKGASSEERKKYGDFLSLPHAERRLPMPEGVDVIPLDERDEEGTHDWSQGLARSLGSTGDGYPPPDTSANSSGIYLVGEGGRPVKLTRLVEMKRWAKRHSIALITTTAVAAIVALLATRGVLSDKPDPADSSRPPRKWTKPKPESVDKAPIIPRILRNAAPEENTQSFAITYEEGGRMKTVILFGKAIDGKDIYQFAAQRGSSEDCHFGMCYLGMHDLSLLLDIPLEELPDTVEKVNVFGKRRPDGTLYKEKVDGSYVILYDIEGQLFAFVQGIGFLVGKADGVDVYTHLKDTLLPRLVGAEIHRSNTLKDAMSNGFAESGPVANFPESMREVSSAKAFPHMPTSCVEMKPWASNTIRMHRANIRAAQQKKQPRARSSLPSSSRKGRK